MCVAMLAGTRTGYRGLQIENNWVFNQKRNWCQAHKFNKCKKSVHEYIGIWKEFTERMGLGRFEKALYL